MREHPHSCPSAACQAGAGPGCGHCGTDERFSFERLALRYPRLRGLLSPGWRLAAGAAFFIAALLLGKGEGLSFVLFLAGYLLAGAGVFIQALAGALGGNLFSEHFLMTVATVGAFVIGEYAEGFAVMLLYLAGQELEHRAVDRTRRSIDALNRIRPVIAHRVTPSGTEDLSPASLAPGERVLVFPGERVPLDGRLEKEGGQVDYSALTGESRPLFLAKGEEVLAGAVNGTTLLTLTVLRNEADSAVMRIMRLAEAAGQKKTRIELFTERFSRVYTPLVVFLALAVALLPPLLLAQPFQVWLYRALHFLVISCPCALVISVPLAYIAGLGKASRRGIYIRGSQYLEALANLHTVVFDKTGTLTDGSFTVTDLVTAPGVAPEELTDLAASAEQHSTHPVALAIGRYRETIRSADLPSAPLKVPQEVRELAGYGVVALIDGQEILAGNRRLLARYGIRPGIEEEDEGRTGSPVHLARAGKWIGALYASDRLRPGTHDAIHRLRNQGTDTIALLSGDRKAAALEAGRSIGADLIASELLPEDKVDELDTLKEKAKGHVAFVGDGINDAPVLRLADVGIALGSLGSDAAIEAADVVIMADEPGRIPDAVSVARQTRRRVHENVAAILLVKGVLLALGALGLTPLWGAVFADTGILLLTVVNSLRAYYGSVD